MASVWADLLRYRDLLLTPHVLEKVVNSLTVYLRQVGVFLLQPVFYHCHWQTIVHTQKGKKVRVIWRQNKLVYTLFL